MFKTINKKDKWIKLICGASNEDIVAIEDLCAIYTAAGVDYIDVAAEESIVNAAKKGIEWAKKVFKNSPGLMISISDGNDICLLYTSPSPRDRTRSRMPSSA